MKGNCGIKNGWGRGKRERDGGGDLERLSTDRSSGIRFI